MDAFPKTNPEQNELSSQAGKAKSAANEHTTQEIRSWDKNKLLLWIQQRLSTTLEPTDAEKILKASISGSVFLRGAGNKEFFQSAGLSFGVSVELAELAKETKQSKYYLSYHGRNSDSQLTVSQGDSEQAGLEEPSDTASQKRGLDSGKEASQPPNQKRLRVSQLPGSGAIYQTESAEVRCVLSFYSWFAF
jgi:hypothetical protein